MTVSEALSIVAADSTTADRPSEHGDGRQQATTTRSEVGEMGCLFVLMATLFPRTVLVIFWLARPERVDEVFSTWLWPLLGIVFLPFATLMYVLLYVPGDGVTGGDWGLVALAAGLDVLHWTFGAAQRRQNAYRGYEGQPI
jgi:hypothetical protein